MAKTKHTPVVFFDSAGNKISNDPVYMAQETLRAAGVTSEEANAAEDQPEGTQAPNAGPAEDDSIDDDESPEDDEETPEEVDLDQLDGKQLKALAAERNVDISGLKKVGEVRQAIRDASAE